MSYVSDDEFGEKSVSVLLDAEESEIVFIDHPAHEMSVSGPLLLSCAAAGPLRSGDEQTGPDRDVWSGVGLDSSGVDGWNGRWGFNQISQPLRTSAAQSRCANPIVSSMLCDVLKRFWADLGLMRLPSCNAPKRSVTFDLDYYLWLKYRNTAEMFRLCCKSTSVIISNAIVAGRHEAIKWKLLARQNHWLGFTRHHKHS